MRAQLFLLACLLGACGDTGREKELQVGQATYRFPDSHVRSITRDPHRFVRIKAPEQSFELVHDSRTSSKTDARGWPVIFSLNDKAAPNIDLHEQGEWKVVCRRAVNPRGGCGLRLSHGGADWDVLFPRSQLAEAAAISERAMTMLETYEA